MAFYFYAKIWNLLMYTVIMNPYLCDTLVQLFLPISMVHALPFSLSVLWLFLCANQKIHYFLCKLTEINKFANNDNFSNNILIYTMGNMFYDVPLSRIFSFTFKSCYLFYNPTYREKMGNLLYLFFSTLTENLAR